MNRVGCLKCGEIVRAGGVFTECTRLGVDDECPEPIAELRTAADVLAFKLRLSEREQEAERVERDMAVLQEHRGR